MKNSDFRFQGSGFGSRSGQAMAEMIVALVGILVVFAGLLAIAHLGYSQSSVMLQARDSAGQDAMSSDCRTEVPSPMFLVNWNPGRDKSKFSADDEPQPADPSIAVQKIVGPCKPDDLDSYVKGNHISALKSSSMLDSFCFVHARVTTNNITLPPIVRHLIYNESNFHIDGDVTLTWTKGIN